MAELRVLVLEDVPTDAELIVRELKRTTPGCVMRRVASESEFIAELESFAPDVICSDYKLPGFSGTAALALARKHRPETPFIFVSGTIGEERAIEALQNGATDYVLKGNLRRLGPAVTRAVSEARLAIEKQRTEARLLDAMRRLDLALDASDIALWDNDVASGKVYLSEHWSKMLGDEPREVVTTVPELLEIAHPDDRQGLLDAASDAIRGSRRKYKVEHRVRTRTGTWKWILSRGKVVERGADGKALRVIGTNVDITERKVGEEALRASEERHRMLVESSPYCIHELDLHGRFASMNRAGQKMLGVGDESAIRGLDCLQIVAEVDRTRVGGLLGRALQGESSEFEFASVNGRVFQSSFVPIMKHDAMRRLMGLTQDITERKHQEQRIARLSRIHEVLSGINGAIVRIRDRQPLFEEACRIAVEHGRFGIAWIGMLDPQTRRIVPVASAGVDAESYIATSPNTASQGTPVGESIADRAVREKRSVFSNDITAESAQGGARRREAIRRGYRSVIALPLLAENEAVGSLSLLATEPNFFDDQEVRLLTELTGDIAFALEHIEKQEKLNYLAYYDPVTGLPNRTLFSDRLQQRIGAARDPHETFSVAMLDIERFRLINDTFGRPAGDEMLRQVSQRLKDILQRVDLLANLGGDRFAIATRRAGEAAAGAHTIDQVIANLSREPFKLGDAELRASARAGIAVYPTDSADVEGLLRNAEAALKNAKQTGQKYLFYARQMNARVAEQVKLENELREAVSRDQYVLHYQPRFNLETRRMVGMEALIRWKHPGRGMVPPGDFIPLLEETGLILDVGRWALRRAAHDHAAWCAKGFRPPRAAVNVSQVQLRRKDFVEDVKSALAPVDRAIERLEIEITESMLMENIEQCIDKLKVLQSAGLHVALDDFGTGYSSLSYLARLPIDSLKIDRSFVLQMLKDADHVAIVTTVISLAKSLDLKVVAEGVETEEQAKLLKLLDCEEAQGYFFARPMPADEIEKLLTV